MLIHDPETDPKRVRLMMRVAARYYRDLSKLHEYGTPTRLLALAMTPSGILVVRWGSKPSFEEACTMSDAWVIINRKGDYDTIIHQYHVG